MARYNPGVQVQKPWVKLIVVQLAIDSRKLSDDKPPTFDHAFKCLLKVAKQIGGKGCVTTVALKDGNAHLLSVNMGASFCDQSVCLCQRGMFPLNVHLSCGPPEFGSVRHAAAMCYQEERYRVQDRVILSGNQHTPVARNMAAPPKFVTYEIARALVRLCLGFGNARELGTVWIPVEALVCDAVHSPRGLLVQSRRDGPAPVPSCQS